MSSFEVNVDQPTTLLSPTNVMGAMTLVLAVVALVVAYRQYAAARATVKLALFEKRYAVYQATVDVVNILTQNAAPFDAVVLERIRLATERAEFVFPRAVVDYVHTLARLVTDEVHDGRPSERAMRHAKDMVQGRVLTTIFGPYLDFSEWR